MKKFIATILAASALLSVYADNSTNSSTFVAPSFQPTLKYPWKSSVSAGLTLTRGNSDTMLFTANFLTTRKTPVNEYSLGLAGAYGDQNSKDTVNNYSAFGQWNHLFTDRFYSYVRADALRDVIADLDYRLTVGPGAGYYLIKETNTLLAAEAGGAFETEKLGSKSDTFATVRFAERFEHKFSPRARIWEHAEILPQVDKFDNYVVNAEIGVEASLTESFSLRTYLDDTYQNRPAAGKLKNDAQLIAAIAYKF